MLLQAAIGHVASVAGKNLGFGKIGREAVFVRVAEDEFSRLERGTGPWRRLFACPFNDRLREPIAVPEVVVRMAKRRRRLQVQRREHFHAGAPRDEFGVLRLAPSALRDVAGEQDDDGVEVRTRQTSDPVVGMIRAGVAENLRAGHHAVLELFWKRRQGDLIHTQRAEPVPGEGHGHPAMFPFDRSPDLGSRLYFLHDIGQPGPSARSVAERQEFVSSRERGYTSYQDVLDVLEFKHGRSCGGSLHLIEHVRESRLELERFLDLVGAYVRVFAVFEEARALVLTEERDDCRHVRLPVLRPSFEVYENRGDAGLDEESHGILEVFVEIGVEDALILEVQPLADVEQHPAQVVEPQWRQDVGVALHRLLNILSVLAHRLLPPRLDLRNDREAMARRGLGEDGAVPSLFELEESLLWDGHRRGFRPIILLW